MGGSFEIIAARLYFHSGWAIQVDPSFDAEVVDGGATLRIFNATHRREVSLSATRYTRRDGGLVTADAILTVFPPPEELSGLRFEHKGNGVAGRALWMFGESDTDAPSWVLMGVMATELGGRMAQCTIVCREESDRDWAVNTWRTLVYAPPP
jgi:hypothetical protein